MKKGAEEFKVKLGVIGFGNMANAIVNGAVAKGVLQKNDVLVSDKEIGKIKSAGFAYADSNSEIVENCEYVLLSVKPQSAPEVFQEIRDRVHGNTFLSIMAGLPAAKIAAGLNGAAVIRCMPNMPCMYGAGAAGVASEHATEKARSFALALFSATGTACEVAEEKLDAVTAVSGSGPAYFYYFVRAMIRSGIRLGLDEQTAKSLAIATAEGAACVLKRSNDSIDTLIDKVCSKGGTTVEAVKRFDERELDAIVAEGMQRCYERSVELSK